MQDENGDLRDLFFEAAKMREAEAARKAREEAEMSAEERARMRKFSNESPVPDEKDSDELTSLGVPVRLDPRFEKFLKGYPIDAEAARDLMTVDSMIARKHWHTYRVQWYAERIAASLGLRGYERVPELHIEESAQDTNGDGVKNGADEPVRFYAEEIRPGTDFELVSTAALLHDIARFRQAAKFATFNDKLSFDHGDEGADILRRGEIFNYTDDPERQEAIIAAVKYHNKFAVPDGLPERTQLMCEIVRDADKLDIMHTQFADAEEDEVQWSLVEDIMAGRLCRDTGKEYSEVDQVLRELGFLFDLNFRESYRIVAEDDVIGVKMRILRRRATNLSENKANEIEGRLREAVGEKLQSQT